MDETVIQQCMDELFYLSPEYPSIVIVKSDGSYLAYGEPVPFDQAQISRLCADTLRLTREIAHEIKQSQITLIKMNIWYAGHNTALMPLSPEIVLVGFGTDFAKTSMFYHDINTILPKFKNAL